MYFKRLEVFGFKSFADKTALEFQPGITGIVGPNGCGKSNVFDAVRWVLGEQSAKDLRGSSMEDVIFNGTDQRPQLGFAEVSLVFSNQSRMLPVEYDEVVVTRRLFRSGESEYLLNKNVCRLKDIIEMFLGTGVGAEAYSLIQQGKVDLVVSAKPEERRQIFDEAAGITKYKSKKKEALSKLKETEDNLLRINDIVVEVKRQIASIERQAKKAQKYKEEFEKLKTYELILSQHHLKSFEADLLTLSQESAALEQKEKELLVSLQDYNQRIEHQSGLVEEIDEQINTFKSNLMRNQNDIDIKSRQISLNEERSAEMDAVCAQLEQDKAAALERCKANQLKIEEIRSQLDELHRSLQNLTNGLQAKRDELKILVHSMEQAEQSIKTYTSEQFNLTSQEVRVKNQLTDLTKRHMELSARRVRLEQDNIKIAGEKLEVHQKFESINNAITLVTTDMEQAWTQVNAQRQAFEEARLQLQQQEQALDEMEKSRVFLVSQKDFIAKMQVQYQGMADPVVEGKFISPVRPGEQQTGIIGKIKSIQELPAAEGQAPLFEMIYETKFIALDLAHMDTRITELDGQIAQSASDKKQAQERLAAQQQEVDAALKQIQDLEKKLSVLEAQKNDIELATGKIVGELDLIASEFYQVNTDLAALKAQEINLNDALNGIVGQIRRCQSDIKAKQDAIAGKNRDREAMNVEIVQIEAQVASCAQNNKGLEERLSVYNQNLDRDLNDVGRFDQQRQESAAKKAQISEETVQLYAAIENLTEAGKSISSQLDESTGQKNEITAQLNGLRQQTRGIEDEIIDLKTQRHAHDMRLQEIQFNQRSLKERLLQAYKIDLDNLPPAEPLPIPEAQAASQAEHGVDLQPEAAAAETTEAPVAQAPLEASSDVVEQPALNVEELVMEIERLKKRCESYGAVNLVAIEEFEELRGRNEFLTKQQSDLLTARESLMLTIQKINRTTRQMFTETFTKVNEEFRIYFKTLFGGGEAELIILDPENALESGIDIVARPPGKKPQHISLLSGGEKTLTAIALIFGVFKVNPSPFCILDEIDAALDESNVGRFAQLLKEFAKIAQFIVITHNKRTMESADILYGVTMPERGISRIVSVRLNQKQPQSIPVDETPATVGAV